jgi:hypothetical protein
MDVRKPLKFKRDVNDSEEAIIPQQTAPKSAQLWVDLVRGSAEQPLWQIASSFKPMIKANWHCPFWIGSVIHRRWLGTTFLTAARCNGGLGLAQVSEIEVRTIGRQEAARVH